MCGEHPAATVEAVEGYQVIQRHNRGDKVDRATPILIQDPQVKFNPYWTVPALIIEKDLFKHERGPEYLTKFRSVFDGKGNEVPPTARLAATDPCATLPAGSRRREIDGPLQDRFLQQA